MQEPRKAQQRRVEEVAAAVLSGLGALPALLRREWAVESGPRALNRLVCACLWQKKEKSASGDVRGLIDLMHIKELKGESREIVLVALDGVLVHVSLAAGLSCAQFG